MKWRSIKWALLGVVTGLIGAAVIYSMVGDGVKTSDSSASEANPPDDDLVANTLLASEVDESESEESGPGPANAAEAVELIRASTFRNKTMDDSPFINTPSAELTNEPSLYETDPNGVYNQHVNDYGVNPFYQKATSYSVSGEGGATFRANCEVSHFSYDDPIVYPGEPERAHLHMFFGNTHTNAFSTYDSLVNSGSSTCNGKELNRTAYWAPAMMNGKGGVVVPFKTRFYYKSETSYAVGKVEAYPDNLQLVADQRFNGNTLGTATFRCNDVWNGAKSNPSKTIPTCSSPASTGQPGALEYQIFFGYCWNGDEAEVGDWKANLDNFVSPLNGGGGLNWHTGKCPDSHPRLFPALVTHIFFDIPAGEDTSEWYLSSDVDPESRELSGERGASAHADWFGAWNKQVNQEWVDNCSNTAGAGCGEGYLEPWQNGNAGSAKALVIRQDWDYGQIDTIPVKDIYEQMCSVAAHKPYEPARGGMVATYCNPSGKHNHQE